MAFLPGKEDLRTGRDVTVDEAREVAKMARRIAAIIGMEGQLDENYRRVKENTVPL